MHWLEQKRECVMKDLASPFLKLAAIIVYVIHGTFLRKRHVC